MHVPGSANGLIVIQEVEFNLKEAERADKVRQMQEWGFDSATIQSTLGIAIDTSLEDDDIDVFTMNWVFYSEYYHMALAAAA